MKDNIAAVTVLYNPEKEFINNIKTYYRYVSLLILIDNSESPDMDFYNGIQENKDVRVIKYNENKGIAKALNDGVELAIHLGFEWVLTMDQDSKFERIMIEKYLYEFNSITDKNLIAAFGPVFKVETVSGQLATIKKVSSLITSGSLINTNIFKEIGRYNEKLFIDEVDHDYCYRAVLKGYSILQLQGVFLNHKLGNAILLDLPFGMAPRPRSVHSPIRLYYMVRNYLYMVSKYKQVFPEEIKRKRISIITSIKNSLLYERNKFLVVKFVIKGVYNFYMGRFGKF